MVVEATRDQRVIPGVGTLAFEEEPHHRYWLLAEEAKRRRRLPSVTQIVNATFAKGGLVKWAAKLGPAYEQARDQAAERGKSVHRFVEYFLAHGELLETADLPEDWQPYIASAAAFLWDFPLAPVSTELLVCHPELGYAGRLDLVAVVDGARTLLDFKTNPAARIYREAHVQAAGYAIAAERCGDPPIERTLLVGIGPDGYQLVEGLDAAKAWGGALALYGEQQRLDRMLNGGEEA